jgi:hypothetical protein
MLLRFALLLKSGGAVFNIFCIIYFIVNYQLLIGLLILAQQMGDYVLALKYYLSVDWRSGRHNLSKKSLVNIQD